MAQARRQTRPERSTLGYLQTRPWNVVILSSFVVLTVPIAVFQFYHLPGAFALAALYAVLLGGTHFVITLGVYLDAGNRRYFSSSLARIAVYFLIPPAILVLFFIIGYYQLTTTDGRTPLSAIAAVFLFSSAVKALDYLHVARQSFGVLQLFRAPVAHAFPASQRRFDNAFFVSMAALQQLTFLNGVRNGNPEFSLNPLSAGLFVIAAVCLLAIVMNFVRAATRTPDRRTWLGSFGYFTLQAASAALPIARAGLYTASLAMHYVEYHVIMFPRLFRHAAAREERGATSWLQRHAVAFYLLATVVAIVISRDVLWEPISSRFGPTQSLWFLFNVLNGMFVAHYFLEAFIWKFRDPYYRRTLAPLYFPQQPLHNEKAGPKSAA